jgi:hypothetical protein
MIIWILVFTRMTKANMGIVEVDSSFDKLRMNRRKQNLTVIICCYAKNAFWG